MPRPIQLHADLAIDPAREAEAVHYFETVYRPTANRFEGYIDLRLLKLQAALVGAAPAGINYRFSITFTSGRSAPELGCFRRTPGRVENARGVPNEARV